MKLLSKQEKWAGKRRKRCLRVPTASGVLNAGVLWQAGNAKKWNSSCVKSENESVTECCKYVGIVCPVSACVPESGAVVWMSSARGMLVLQHSSSGARPGHCAGQHLASSVNSLDDVFSVSMPDCWRLTADDWLLSYFVLCLLQLFSVFLQSVWPSHRWRLLFCHTCMRWLLMVRVSDTEVVVCANTL